MSLEEMLGISAPLALRRDVRHYLNRLFGVGVLRSFTAMHKRIMRNVAEEIYMHKTVLESPSRFGEQPKSIEGII